MTTNDGRRPHEGIFRIGDKGNDAIRSAPEECRSGIIVSGPSHIRSNVLRSLAENVFALDSGMVYALQESDITTFSKIASLAAQYGRNDDLLVLNFANRDSDPAGNSNKLSSTMNPFASGRYEELTQIVVGLLDWSGSDGPIWRTRSTALMTGVLQALTWLRDNRSMALSAEVIRRHLPLSKLVELANSDKNTDMPQTIRDTIRTYLSSLRGYRDDREPQKQPNTALDQHEYLQLVLEQKLGVVADIYGHIFQTGSARIDISDVLSNRRFLIVILPTFSTPGVCVDDLITLLVETIRATASSRQLQKSKTTAPFTIIFDDAEYYFSSQIASLVRSANAFDLNFVFGCKDIDTFTNDASLLERFIVIEDDKIHLNAHN